MKHSYQTQHSFSPAAEPVQDWNAQAELADLRQQLERLVGAVTSPKQEHHSFTEWGPKSASEILKFRDRRSKFFDGSLFADPAWDMLLELYVASAEQRRMTISNLCVSARVPMTTGLRWTNLLEQRQLIERRPDPLDGRRVFVALTQAGLTAMKGLFEKL